MLRPRAPTTVDAPPSFCPRPPAPAAPADAELADKPADRKADDAASCSSPRAKLQLVVEMAEGHPHHHHHHHPAHRGIACCVREPKGEQDGSVRHTDEDLSSSGSPALHTIRKAVLHGMEVEVRTMNYNELFTLIWVYHIVMLLMYRTYGCGSRTIITFLPCTNNKQ